MTKWISDRLPDNEGAYLVYAASENKDKPFIQIAWFYIEDKSWGLIPSIWAKAITHWMPLPDAPND